MGEHSVYKLFKRALKMMLDTGEFDKEFRHKKRVRKLKAELEQLDRQFGIESMPLPLLLYYINDREVLQDIICYMATVGDSDD